MPQELVAVAGWAWRLLVLAVAAYAAVWVLSRLAVVVLPIIAALFLSALLRPLARQLDRYTPRLVAAWLTILIAGAVVAGVGYFIGLRAAAAAPELVDQLIDTFRQLIGRLQRLPMVGQLRLARIEQAVTGFLQQNRQMLTDLLVSGTRYLVKVATGLVLMVFVAFFFVYEGERLWGWMMNRLPGRPALRINSAGQVAWHTISGWITGTVVIATIHGIVIAVTLLLVGVPLVAPIAMLVFFGSFVPIVGALVAGGVAVLVTLGTAGTLSALIVLVVLIVENQLEGNLLQPLIMSHYVRLNPLVIGVALVVGSVLFGIVGAILAVPATSVCYRALPVLLRRNLPEETDARAQ